MTIQTILELYWFELTAGAILLGLLIHTAILSRRLKAYKKMTALVRGGNIEEHICNLEERFAEQQKLLESLGLSIEAVKSELKSFPRHWHLVRYNAFDKTGSDLSFTLALLNDQMDGFVLTSIFGREDSRVYAKPLLGGKSQYALSQEEQQAIKAAMKNNR
ncbi:MAG: DUF4446 family protein [Bacillota bacterium]|jgi:hypothetical protein